MPETAATCDESIAASCDEKRETIEATCGESCVREGCFLFSQYGRLNDFEFQFVKYKTVDCLFPFCARVDYLLAVGLESASQM